MSIGTPPSDVTQSIATSAPCFRAAATMASMGWRAPVVVSTCTNARSFVFFFASARSTSAGSTISPGGTSTTSTSAPARRAISASRCPKYPVTATTRLRGGPLPEYPGARHDCAVAVFEQVHHDRLETGRAGRGDWHRVVIGGAVHRAQAAHRLVHEVDEVRVQVSDECLRHRREH